LPQRFRYLIVCSEGTHLGRHFSWMASRPEATAGCVDTTNLLNPFFALAEK
jgi:hypothetical protein